MLATTPETFDLCVKNNILLFHGTNSNALPNILKYGMKSVVELTKSGIAVSTGEASTRREGKRSFISFTDDLETAIDYSKLLPIGNEQKLSSFGVVIGISKDDIKKLKTYNIRSDVPEIGIKNSIPLEFIKFIAVPSQRMEFVKKMVKNEQISVTALDLDKKFYSYYESMLIIDDKKAKEFKEGKAGKEKTFKTHEVAEVAKGRRLPKIIEMYHRLKERIDYKKKGVKDDSREE